MNKKLNKLVILASGTGSIFLSLVKACKANILPAQTISLVCDNPKALVIAKAKKEKVPVLILDIKNFSSLLEWNKALLKYLQSQKPDLILLAGFLKKIGKPVLENFKNQIINIHPSLLPKYGGHGMYGIHVHRQVLEAGETKTGISIHLVSEEYDAGRILAQKQVPILPEDTVVSLQERVKKIEAKFYVDTLKKIMK